MEIERRKRNRRFILKLGIIGILITVVVLSISYALYEKKEQVALVKSVVSSGNDIELSVVIDGVLSTNIPSAKNYTVEVDCGNTAYGEWDYVEWGAKITKLRGKEVKCTLTFTKTNLYVEEKLNGADPVLADNLIPVKIDEAGKVYKANTDEEWYKYEEKKWANAVVTFSDKEYENNEVIAESDIKQYYVWIPRYKYQLWNVGGGTLSTDTNYPNGTEHESAINIVFENKDTTPSTGSNNGEWLTHPAFTNFDTDGIWVGKFEPSYNEETYTNKDLFLVKNPNVGVATNADNIIIKPNVRSLTNKDVSTFYTLGREINTNLNSHMMTNMEWGAATYLTYSLYGKCTTSSCEEVYLNNISTGRGAAAESFSGQWTNSGAITGCSATSTNDAVLTKQNKCIANYAWNEENNKASTTGNTTGIYDMSGGAWDYVMGVVVYSDGTPLSGASASGNDMNHGNSGFNGIYGNETPLTRKENGLSFPTDKRYYNLYVPYSYELKDNTRTGQLNGLLGDATKEMYNKNVGSSLTTPWFSDNSYFVTMYNPWVGRGGPYNDRVASGLVYIFPFSGAADRRNTFRVVLAP